MYDSLYGLATTSTHPWLIQCTSKNGDIDLPTLTNTSYSHRTSSCLSTTPTNTSYSHRSSSCCSMTSTNTSYDLQTCSCLSTTSTIPATNINHRANVTNNELSYVLVNLTNKLSYLLFHFCFLHCSFGCHYSHA